MIKYTSHKINLQPYLSIVVYYRSAVVYDFLLYYRFRAGLSAVSRIDKLVHFASNVWTLVWQISSGDAGKCSNFNIFLFLKDNLLTSDFCFLPIIFTVVICSTVVGSSNL